LPRPRLSVRGNEDVLPTRVCNAFYLSTAQYR
jgi:hypothetical protein